MKGCLSSPEWMSEVNRPEQISVEYLDSKGTPVEEVMQGLLARIFMHEYDHLQGGANKAC